MTYKYKEIEMKLLEHFTRRKVREFVVNKFLKEEPGTGTINNATRYKYLVNIPNIDRKIYLKRPANLKLGFDFQIWVENWKRKGVDKMPKHQDIINDLSVKQKENNQQFRYLLKAIEWLFKCKADKEIVEDLENKKINFNEGEELKILLRVIKWMFIEQDIRYWNFSGRNKLKSYIFSTFDY